MSTHNTMRIGNSNPSLRHASSPPSSPTASVDSLLKPAPPRTN